MSKKTDQIYQQMLAAYLQALQGAQTPSGYENLIGGQATDILNWAKSGDYRSPPKGMFVNLADPAVRKQQREMVFGAGARGSAALGAPNATALKLDEQNRSDEFDRDQAANYQSEVSNAIGNATGTAGNLAGMDLQRKQGILGTTAGLYSQTLQRQLNPPPSWWRTFTQSFGNSLGHTLGSGGFAAPSGGG